LNDFEKYKNTNPDDFEVFFEIGSLIFHKFNDIQKAKEYLLESLKLNPNHFNTNNILGLINQSESNFNTAISYFSDAIRINPEYPFTYISRADIYISQKEFQKALEDIEKAMEHEQARPLALKLRANINNKLDEYETAITDLNTAIMLDPDYVDAYIDRGDSWSYLKEYGKAIFDYFQAIMIEFKRGTLIKLKTHDPLKIVKLEEILKIFGENMSISPKDFSKSFDLADICWVVRNGKYPHRIVDNAVHLNPNDVKSLHFLSFINNVILKKTDYSINLITRCIELEPNNPSFFIDRAEYYEKKGDFTLAAKDYEEAARLDPEKYQDTYLEFLENHKEVKSE
jgi:tetratricopeptide (TPR) repeat protein